MRFADRALTLSASLVLLAFAGSAFAETRDSGFRAVSETRQTHLRSAVDAAASRSRAPIAAPAGAADRETLAPHQRLGAPYSRGGVWYMPVHEPAFNDTGVAGVMARDLVGRRTANGETLRADAMTAAHPTLPLPSLLEVTNVATGRTVTVRLNDRGPFLQERMLDLSPAAASALGLKAGETAQVRARYIGPAPAAAPAPLPPPAVLPRALVAEAPQTPVRIQAAAFSSESNAQRARARLADLGETRIEARDVRGATLYRLLVLAGSRSEAEAKLQRIAALGMPDARVIAH
jgi:rare lipoprotein A